MFSENHTDGLLIAAANTKRSDTLKSEYPKYEVQYVRIQHELPCAFMVALVRKDTGKIEARAVRFGLTTSYRIDGLGMYIDAESAGKALVEEAARVIAESDACLKYLEEQSPEAPVVPEPSLSLWSRFVGWVTGKGGAE